ncbi:MAG: class I SAM-dependent methyltransferase [Ardenticatenaceae bacterium]|nr:class I SAM-dependent methyltransferase [Ardenticatenaceae bacterium]
MNHADHVTLIKDGVPGPGGTWADFGSGTGAFTLALADLIGPTGQIISVDKNRRSLRRQEEAMRGRFPDLQVNYLQADFSRPLDLPLLDGALMANALHFHRRPDRVLQLIHNYLRPGGRLIVVEYNVDRGNIWVPHPFSYTTWETMARGSGFVGTQRLASRPSRFLGEIYAAVSLKPTPFE